MHRSSLARTCYADFCIDFLAPGLGWSRERGGWWWRDGTAAGIDKSGSGGTVGRKANGRKGGIEKWNGGRWKEKR